MELEDIQRKIQFRQGSYTVTIPLQIVHALGIRRNQYVRFAVSKNKVIIKPVESGISKKDVAEADRYTLRSKSKCVKIDQMVYKNSSQALDPTPRHRRRVRGSLAGGQQKAACQD
ncbi:MAG: AbrB/MazE/SpoVT family DNA-binding domain-containing protein [Thaumarchaeota archaeon]|nr:AbrB/MazE/SpoVT family DNA-binding domain-containing protein [Nitrososphaerota archaeon]